MSGNGIIGYWYREISHYSSHHCNNDGIFDDKILEVSTGDKRRVHRSLETSHYSSRNLRVYHSNDNARSGYRSQETRH